MSDDTPYETLARRATNSNDSFAYNTRSEPIETNLGTNHYAYSYDNIGNRKTVQ